FWKIHVFHWSRKPVRPARRAGEEIPMTQHPGVLTAARALDTRQSSSLPIGLDQLARPGPSRQEPAIAGDADPAIDGGDLTRRVQPTHPKVRLRALLLAGVGLLAVAASGYFGWQYWTVGRFNISTDNAYVKADNISIAPKVSGYIASVL